MEKRDSLDFKEGAVVAIPFFGNLKFIVGIKRTGGMGSVYQLIPLMPNTPVLALKTYQGTINYKQFTEEARIWISLGTHPNIAKAISFGEMKGTHCILAIWCAENMNSIDPRLMKYDEVRSFVHGIFDGLEYGQKMNHLIHKDIKPANILIDKSNAPRIADFGISSASSPSVRISRRTKTQLISRLTRRNRMVQFAELLTLWPRAICRGK
ncbi:MAG: protein kinase [Propionivibrio sp.]|nr:protein kinase [Propionivibrio sp.]